MEARRSVSAPARARKMSRLGSSLTLRAASRRNKMRTSMAGPSDASTEASLGGARGRAHLVLDGGDEAMDVLAVHAGNQITYLGLVDILTHWTVRKRLEHAFTGVLRCRDVSCQPPARYAQRMLRFLDDVITSDAPPDEASPAARDSSPSEKVRRTRSPRPEPKLNRRSPEEVSL